MNLLIPGLGLTLLLVAMSFSFAAKLAPILLLAGSTVLLFYAYNLHRTQFENDYKNSTWQKGLKSFGPLIMVGIVIVLAYGYFAMTSPSYTVGGGRGSRR
jgi:hypothetical protein